MLVHVTRHGQVQPPNPGEVAGVDYPINDRPLSELGCQQAALLGKRLAASGFAGTIYASPFIRTVATGQIIAEIVDCPVVLCAAIREAVIVPERTEGFRGVVAEELVRRFNRLRVPDDYVYPWWDNRPETSAEVEARVGPFIEWVLQRGDREALLIGHGSSVRAAIRYVLRTRSPAHLQQTPPTKAWNCALTSMKLLPAFELVTMMCTAHLPESAITSNISFKADVLRRYQERLAAKARG